MGAERIQVIVEPCQQLFACRAGLFYDRVLPHGHSSASSSGVQMTGGSNPAERHVSDTNRSIRAFAMCLQFQAAQNRPRNRSTNTNVRHASREETGRAAPDSSRTIDPYGTVATPDAGSAVPRRRNAIGSLRLRMSKGPRPIQPARPSFPLTARVNVLTTISARRTPASSLELTKRKSSSKSIRKAIPPGRFVCSMCARNSAGASSREI